MRQKEEYYFSFEIWGQGVKGEKPEKLRRLRLRKLVVSEMPPWMEGPIGILRMVRLTFSLL